MHRTYISILAGTLAVVAAAPALAQTGDSPAVIRRYEGICSNFISAATLGAPRIDTVAGRGAVDKAKVEQRAGAPLAKAITFGQRSALAISDVVHLARGDMFVCRTTHAAGLVDWSLAYSPLSHRVEQYDVSFLPAPVEKVPEPAPEVASPPAQTEPSAPPPAPASPKQAPAASPSVPNPPAPSISEACKMFPDLC